MAGAIKGPWSRDREADCRINSGNAQWWIMFDDDRNFENALKFRHNNQDNKPGRHNMTFYLLAKTGGLRFRDTRQNPIIDKYSGRETSMVQTVASIVLERDSFVVLHNGPAGEQHEEPATSWIIDIQLHAGKTFQVEASFEPESQKVRALSHSFVHLWEKREEVEDMGFMRLVLLQYDQVKVWDGEKVQRILLGESPSQSPDTPEGFIALCKAGVAEEAKYARDELALENRASIDVALMRHGSLTNRNKAILTSTKQDDNWKPDIGSEIQLTKGKFSEHGAPMIPGANEDRGWVVRVTSVENDGVHGIFLNDTSSLHNVMHNAPISRGIDAEVVDDNQDEERARWALGLLEKAFAYEAGKLSANDLAENPKARLRLPMTKRLLRSYGGDLGEDHPIPFRAGRAAFDYSGLRLEAERHRQFFEMVQQGTGGLAVCQGPPGTGKTTLLANLTCSLLTQLDLGNERVCLMAHSNTAISVLVERVRTMCLTLYENKNIVPQKHIVLIRSEASSERLRLAGREDPPGVEELTLEAHLGRLSASEPNKWSAYKRGRDALQKYGHIADKGTRQLYFKDLHDMYDIIKETALVFGCTLAQCTHTFFLGFDRGRGSFPCRILLIDEASQSTRPSEIAAWFAMNPTNIVLAGDHKQLSPYLQTDLGKLAFGKTLMEGMIDRGGPFVLLNIEYRSPTNIYNATSVTHYQGQVTAHPSCNERESTQDVVRAASRLSFIDKEGHTYQLSSNVHFFDVMNGKSEIKGQTKSSRNELELQFIGEFVRALGLAKIPGSKIMALTGYAAQWEVLVEMGKKTGMAARKIDSSQGDERDLVIFSLVHGAGVARLGFMKTPNRQNVATSRARDAMWYVGCHSAYMNSSLWVQYLRQQKKDQVNPDSFLLSFKGPVKFLIDGQDLDSFSLPPPPPPQPDTPAENELAKKEQDLPEPSSPTSSTSLAQSEEIAASGAMDEPLAPEDAGESPAQDVTSLPFRPSSSLVPAPAVFPTPSASDARRRVLNLPVHLRDHVFNVLRPAFREMVDGAEGAIFRWSTLLGFSTLRGEEVADVFVYLQHEYEEEKQRVLRQEAEEEDLYGA